jgi:hypothetical protein
MDLINFENEKQIVEKSFIFSKNLALYRYRAKALSHLLIKDDGSINLEKLHSLQDFSIPSYGLKEQEEHLKHLFKLLLEDKNLQKKIINFDFPITENFENMVRLSLDLTDEIITKTHLRKAVLAALFGYLRQTVGSCFATAPCLYVLKRHPDYFLDDLYMLSKKGSLQRLSHGQLIEVPMAANIGSHFLTQKILGSYQYDSVFLHFISKHHVKVSMDEPKTFLETLGEHLSYRLYVEAHDPLLKIWEYTVASLCDAKGEFTESTLYLTLGLDAKMPDGLGEFFLNSFQKKLDQKHALLVQAQNEAYLAHQRLVMAENIAKNASTESSLQRAKSEILAANYELHARTLDVEDFKKEQDKVKHLYDKKIALIKETIPRFFQESYDPDLVNMKSYSDDAPAGFRLFIKDGKLTSRFSPISNEDDFVKALKQFFEKIEGDLMSYNFDKDNRQTISDVITETIQFSSSKEFIQSTYMRAQKRHPHALPWAYVSGGTLETLLKTYFRKELLKIKVLESDTIKSFFIELVDYFKALPENYLEPFRKNPNLSLLLETKTHACQLLPGSPLFRSLWESSSFTYTEIRDKIIEKGRHFYAQNKHKIIPEEFFKKMGKNIAPTSVGDLLKDPSSEKENIFLITAFLLHDLDLKDQEEETGFCILGDTNWTYSHLVIGYHPFKESLGLFAKDPDSCGLLHLNTMESLPLKWKIYDDLNRVELLTPGIKI